MTRYRIIRQFMSERMFRKSLDIMLVLAIYLLLCFPAVAEGFTVKSIDQMNDSFMINLVLNDGGQSIEGYINGADFDIDGIEVNSKIKLSVSQITEHLNYAVLNQGALWKYEVIYYDASGFDNGAKCTDIPIASYCFIIDIPGRIGFGNDRVIIIQKVPAGSYGGLQNPDLSWIGTMALAIDGKEYKKSIGSGEAARGSVQFPIGSVQWVGSLVTGQAVPNQNLYVATHRLDIEKWNIAPKTDYEAYIKSMTEVDTILQVWKKQQDKYEAWDKETYEELVCTDELCSDLANILTVHNSNVDILLSKNVGIDYGSVTARSSVAGYDGNIYDVIDRRIANPELVINLKASSLNVVVLTGKPQIQDIFVPNFSSGDNTGYVRVLVKNIGDAQGTFASRTNGSFESNKITLTPNEIGSMVLFLKSGINASLIKKENVEVYDINSGASDSREFQINIIQPKTHIPNETRVYNDVAIKADITGMVETKEAECSSGLWQYVSGTYQCQDLKTAVLIPQVQTTIPPPKPLILEPPVLEKETGFDYMWLVVILLVIILILIILKTVSGYLGFGRKALKKGIPLILIIIGLGVIITVAMLALYWGIVLEYVNRLIIEYTFKNITEVKL